MASSKMTPRKALLILNGLPSVGPVMLRRLFEAFDRDPVAILNGSRSQLLSVKGVGEKAASILMNWESHFDVSREIEKMRASGIRFLAQTDAFFPLSLREMYDPPIGLYWKGDYVINQPCIAIVGTRRGTLYGSKVAKSFSAGLSRAGFCIVSGLARGTDTAAHEGALEVGGRTVAVLGCGLDIVYPPENLGLYNRIAESGALASEFPLGRRADRQTFPMRNRVVAGMCEGVIVVESDAAGGSMITARFAGEQGRQIFAIPGRIDQSASRGCHQLIRDGATMVTSVEEVLEELNYQQARDGPTNLDLNAGRKSVDETFAESVQALSGDESAIYTLLADGAQLSLDELILLSKKQAPAVSTAIMSLEIKQRVAKRADGRFERR